jgi:glycosyltransferase involved in cell wall biosynthesis
VKFSFYSPISFEPWDHRSLDDTGIGGSETCVTELAARLAARGHEVTSYAPLREGCPDRDRGGARWLPLEVADFSAPGIWVLSRCPAALDHLPPLPGRRVWFVAQDVDYTNPHHELTAARCAALERLFALCPTHREHLAAKYPALADKLQLSTNGIRTDLMEEREHTHPVDRNPCRIAWTGSPDRGLIRSLEIFRRAREFEPRLELVACYGLDNIRRCEGPYWRSVEARVESLANQPGVTWTGRLPQPQLHDVIRGCGLWVYCTDFTETSCVCSMEAQALGAVPVFSPVWALNDNVGHGIAVAGPPDEPLTRARFLHAILTLTRDIDLQSRIRSEMVPWARERFSWERVVDQYEAMALGHEGRRSYVAQYAFQLAHATGRVLNVGSNADVADFGAHGGVNLDICPVDPHHGCANRVDVLHDARRPLPFRPAAFDTAILGDILEHMTDADAAATLRNAAAVLGRGGRLVITWPEDGREHPGPHPGAYAAGIDSYHARPVTREMMRGWLAAAGLREEVHRPIEYGFGRGHGVVAVTDGASEVAA